MEGKVIKKQSNLFVVYNYKNTFKCTAKKNLKENGIRVGDNVAFDEKTLNIEKVLTRKNVLLRPPLANLDQLIILLTSEPKPDFLLVDKLILFCKINNIQPVLCHSKIDLGAHYIDYLEKTYKNVCPIIELSSLNKLGLNSVMELLKNKISAFAGQSGVGKSALINAIFGEGNAVEGQLSEKISRGKNTTRHTELYMINKNSFVADTAGFSSLDEKFLPIKNFELPYYYDDFLKFLPSCKYKSCTHINEPNCAVKKAVENGELDKDRYERYLIIFSNLSK